VIVKGMLAILAGGTFGCVGKEHRMDLLAAFRVPANELFEL